MDVGLLSPPTTHPCLVSVMELYASTTGGGRPKAKSTCGIFLIVYAFFKKNVLNPSLEVSK